MIIAGKVCYYLCTCLPLSFFHPRVVLEGDLMIVSLRRVFHFKEASYEWQLAYLNTKSINRCHQPFIQWVYEYVQSVPTIVVVTCIKYAVINVFVWWNGKKLVNASPGELMYVYYRDFLVFCCSFVFDECFFMLFFVVSPRVSLLQLIPTWRPFICGFKPVCFAPQSFFNRIAFIVLLFHAQKKPKMASCKMAACKWDNNK